MIDISSILNTNRQAHQGNIIIPKHGRIGRGFSHAEMLESVVHPGRRTDGSQSAASWVTELADNRTAILLCTFCQPKFNSRRNKYRAKYTPDPTGITSGYCKGGMCDACKSLCVDGRLYIAEDYWEQVSQDPGEARRNSRMAWRKPSWRSRIFGK